MSLRAPGPAGRATRPPEGVTRGSSPSLDGAVALELYVVVAYGLNLAEIAATVRSQVAYEVERLTGLHGRLGGASTSRCAAVRMSDLELSAS